MINVCKKYILHKSYFLCVTMSLFNHVCSTSGSTATDTLGILRFCIRDLRANQWSDARFQVI